MNRSGIHARVTAFRSQQEADSPAVDCGMVTWPSRCFNSAINTEIFPLAFSLSPNSLRLPGLVIGNEGKYRNLVVIAHVFNRDTDRTASVGLGPYNAPFPSAKLVAK